MRTVAKRVAERLSTGLKRYQPVVAAAQARDVNESDTSMIVSDMLAELFGFDKYSEITRELCIRGTYCDLAIRVDGKLQFLVEVKAVGVTLKDSNVKQVVDYASNQGIEWVALTNAASWQVYRVVFGKPIEKELVLDIELLELSPRNDDDIARLFLLTRESIVKSALDAYHDQKQAMGKFFLAAVILSDPAIEVVRRELRRLSPELRVEIDELREAVTQGVLKREVIEGDQADRARKKVQRASGRLLRGRAEEEEPSVTATPRVTPVLQAGAEKSPAAKT